MIETLEPKRKIRNDKIEVLAWPKPAFAPRFGRLACHPQLGTYGKKAPL